MNRLRAIQATSCRLPSRRTVSWLHQAQAIRRFRLWDVATGMPHGEPFKGHSGEVRSVVFSPDSKLVASNSSDKTVRLWDVATGALYGKPLKGDSSYVRSVVFSPDLPVSWSWRGL